MCRSRSHWRNSIHLHLRGTILQQTWVTHDRGWGGGMKDWGGVGGPLGREVEREQKQDNKKGKEESEDRCLCVSADKQNMKTEKDRRCVHRETKTAKKKQKEKMLLYLQPVILHTRWNGSVSNAYFRSQVSIWIPQHMPANLLFYSVKLRG